MDIDPFADDDKEYRSTGAEEPVVSNRIGISNVRQALSRWWIMLIFGVLGYFAALYYMSINPPSSEAIAVLEVNIQTGQLLGQDLVQERMTPDIILATEASKLMGPAILSATAQSPEVRALRNAIPPEFSFKPRYMRTEEELAFKPASSVEVYELVSSFGSWITISGRRGTSLIDVRVKHQDAEAARVIADTLLKVYLEKEESQLIGGSDDAFKILKKEADGARLEMELAEKSLQFYVSAIKLSEQIQEKRNQVIILRQRYLPKHPARIQEEALYTDLLESFGGAIKRSSGKPSEKSYWLEYKDEMDALEKIIDGDGPDKSDAADKWVLLSQGALASRAKLLNNTSEQTRDKYQSISQRMTEIDVADNQSMNNLKVVEPAFIGLAKESVRLIYLAAGSIFGIFTGFAAAFGLSILDYKIYDVRSAEEATGLTCMAAIPASSKFGRQDKWQSILSHDPHSANAESIRNLRASVILLGKHDNNKVLLVTSAIPGEGKTTVAAELAAAFAMNKERTLLVDLDLRRPALSGTFPDLDGGPGIVEVLAGQASIQDVFSDTEIENLTVVCSGAKAPNPSELLNEGEFNSLLEDLIPEFDRIILDSAPVLPVADSRLLAKHAHAVILVVRTRKTPIGAMIRACDLLKASGAKLGGVVVNGMKRTGGSNYLGYKGHGEYGGEEYGYYGGDK
ncbi:polysaccharide biosynthesis tyrosine autokinase [Rubritalea profundi]|uniref:AAA domain-containing protein n=1 Tax=Rubritalea profundi TaxID=1658618 RepID=A0A2S7U0Z3_9BACT|nr:polysaccharide biosynthesis tyrosine autokinase [Rubritalea profundi]PQJ28064.1 hypothetical protein BSZ32_05810 [Rubritalea profundi]